jgi:hypothetical protein
MKPLLEKEVAMTNLERLLIRGEEKYGKGGEIGIVFGMKANRLNTGKLNVRLRLVTI